MNSDLAGRSSKARIAKLDSLRGLAAISVVLLHCRLSLPEQMQNSLASKTSWLWPFAIIEDGNDAVRFFFILSGFVLSFAFFGNSRPTYGSFIMRRVCRIYLPFLAMIAMATTAYAVMPQSWGGPVSKWLEANWEAPTLKAILENTFMTGYDNTLNPPSWSLFIEMRIALLFPLIILAIERFGGKCVSAATFVVWAISQRLLHVHMAVWADQLNQTLHFLFLFSIGAALAQRNGNTLNWYRGLGRLQSGLLWGAGIALIEYRYIPGSLPMQPVIPMFGVTLLFPLLVHSTSLDRFLNLRYLKYLGTISYSLYLCHFPILVILMHMHAPSSAPWAGVLADLPISLLAAVVFNRLLEIPSARLGNRFTLLRPQATAVA